MPINDPVQTSILFLPSVVGQRKVLHEGLPFVLFQVLPNMSVGLERIILAGKVDHIIKVHTHSQDLLDPF
jgi:hypothetical protein